MVREVVAHVVQQEVGVRTDLGGSGSPPERCEASVIRMKQVVVAGGCGKAGQAVARELVECGYQALNVDLVLLR
jgi:hypothetical protein